MIAKLIFNIGQRLRNPSLKSWLLFLKSTETWSKKDLEKYQLKKLQELVNTAYLNSVYYKQKFDEVGVKPANILCLSDIKKLPIISKEELIKFNNKIHTNLQFPKLFKASTSGTSGTSLKFNREENADSFNRATIFRGYSWYNVQPWERNGYFWGFNFSVKNKIKTRILDILQNRFRLFNYKQKSINKFLQKLKNATYLHGYSSMIFEVAKELNKNNTKAPSKLKLIKGTSEKIYETYQNEVKKAFGLKMISEYGAAETGIIAFECSKGNMHLNMEGVLVEEVDNEIIVTNLQMHSFPIIRYKLGDYIKLAKSTKQCSCGLKHTILEEITGRVGAVVYGEKDKYPSLYFYYIFKNIVSKHQLYLNYKVLQNEKGLLTFLIEQKLDAVEISYLKNEIKLYFKNDISFEIKTEQLIGSKNEKNKSFISYI